MKFTRKGYGELRRGNDLISRHTVPEEAYERASAEGEGTYSYRPPSIEIVVPKAAVPAPAPNPAPAPAPSPSPSPAPVPSPAPAARLLRASDLRYLGRFAAPLPIGDDGDGRTLNYGGTALGVGRNGDTLFVTGHDHKQLSCEITIPEPTLAPNDAPRAQYVQSFADAFAGRIEQINPGDPNAKKIGGHLVWGDKLLVSAYAYYDGAGTQSKSHIIRPLDLSDVGHVVGPIGMAGASPRRVAGSMCAVPDAWRDRLGPALSGIGGLAIITASSAGPCAATFDPDDMSAGAQLLVGYPVDRSLARAYGAHESQGQNDYWNLTSSSVGIAFPHSHDSVLFIGRHGMGAYCYGGGGADGPCIDPIDSSKGGHAYPYRFQVWAYDANDLVRVRRGEVQPWEIKPYDIWTLDLPFGRADGAACGGATYDPASNRIIIAQRYGQGAMPLFHVFEIAAA